MSRTKGSRNKSSLTPTEVAVMVERRRQRELERSKSYMKKRREDPAFRKLEIERVTKWATENPERHKANARRSIIRRSKRPDWKPKLKAYNHDYYLRVTKLKRKGLK